MGHKFTAWDWLFVVALSFLIGALVPIPWSGLFIVILAIGVTLYNDPY